MGSIAALRRGLLLVALMVWKLSIAGDIDIAVELNPVGSFTAKSSELQGHASARPDGSYSAQSVTLDLGTLKSEIALRDDHMKNDYFEISKPGFKQATLKSLQAKDGRFKAKLEIRKTTVDIEGKYRVSGKNIEAEFPTALSAFKIKEANYMGVGVVDEVKVKVKLPIQ
jgi:hypothetical protein